ncbi:hypothetical protein HDU98_000854 [Podochytrium sp. JEL0797]|nr:hypothetical protein HDU98_000854 [Podochytrium sp. JEL0797]
MESTTTDIGHILIAALFPVAFFLLIAAICIISWNRSRVPDVVLVGIVAPVEVDNHLDSDRILFEEPGDVNSESVERVVHVGNGADGGDRAAGEVDSNLVSHNSVLDEHRDGHSAAGQPLVHEGNGEAGGDEAVGREKAGGA